METLRLSGVLPVVQTPFDLEGLLDGEALERELHWVLDQGVSGLTTGMVSELLRLTEAERETLGALVISVARERGVLAVLSCGAESTAQAIRYVRRAAELGAHGVMVIPPTTVTLGDEATFEYFVDIARATPLALVVQDASGYVGRPLSISLQARLHEELGDQVYFKPEAPPLGQRLTQLREATGGAARTFEGTGGVNLVDGYHRGVVGSMPGAEVCWAVEAMWRALTTGDESRAYRINAYLALLINLQTSLDSYVAVEKYLLWRQGVLERTVVRGPTGYQLDDGTRGEIDRLLELLQHATYGDA
jgi:4-hydroxy-tetrahydrodipicolinate synthase